MCTKKCVCPHAETIYTLLGTVRARQSVHQPPLARVQVSRAPAQSCSHERMPQWRPPRTRRGLRGRQLAFSGPKAINEFSQKTKRIAQAYFLGTRKDS